MCELLFTIESYHPDPDGEGVLPVRRTIVKAKSHVQALALARWFLKYPENTILLTLWWEDEIPDDAEVVDARLMEMAGIVESHDSSTPLHQGQDPGVDRRG